MPRVKRAIADSGDFEAVSLAATPPEETLPFESGDIEVMAAERLEFAAREEKFMNEKVVIHIEMGTQAGDPVFVELGHNGINQFIKRGEDQVVKRKFLYSALMAKKVSMNCAFGKDGSGNEFNRLTPSVSTAYRALLVSDNNPQGGAKWVQRVMQESSGARA